MILSKGWAVGGALLVLFLAALKVTKPAARLAIVSSLAAMIVAGYLAEGLLRFEGKRSRVVMAVARKLGRSGDGRTVRQVIADYRAKGTKAYPCCAGPWDFETLARSNQPGLLPLTMGSHEFVVFCNESGTYLTYETDEHGFHNPPGAWSRNPLQVALVGDSYTHGMCVSEEAHFVQAVRARYPATLNLGIRGSGPLIMLAAFKEYAAPLHPQKLLWVFFENDFDDLRDEQGLPRLTQYVGSRYTQSLAKHQREIDSIVAAQLDRRIAAAFDVGDKEQLIDFFKLTYVRLNLVGRKLRAPEESEYRLFQSILGDVNCSMRQWRGKLFLVYLPDIHHFLRGPKSDHPVLADMRRRIRDIAARENIPVIDVTDQFRAHPDPKSLYFYPGSHYTEEGYRIVGQMIVEVLGR